MSVTSQAFESHLQMLRQQAYPMGLGQFVHALSERRLPRRAVAITFDDGYANNLFLAKPLLERYDIPATVFVTTGALGGNREFWWDELRKLLGRAGRLHGTISLKINDNTYHWNLDDGSEGEKARMLSRWRVGKRIKKLTTSRESTLSSIHKLLKWSSEEERRKVMEEVSQLAGSSSPARDTHRPMADHEVAKLAAGGLVEIGAHTVTHPVLSGLPVKSQEREIRASKLRLEEIIGRSIGAFAYPYGSRRDYTAETVRLVQEAGFTYACSNFRDVVFPTTDRFQLPRVPVRNWEAEELARRLWFRF